MSEKLSERDRELVQVVMKTAAEIDDERKTKKREQRDLRSQEPRVQEKYEIDSNRFTDPLIRLLLDTYMYGEEVVERIIAAKYKVPYRKYTDGMLLELTKGQGFSPEYGLTLAISERCVYASSHQNTITFHFFEKEGTVSVLLHKGRRYISLNTDPISILAVFCYFGFMTENHEPLYTALMDYISTMLPFNPGDVDLVGNDDIIEHCLNILETDNEQIMNRHILLAGPPGCGKTMIAKKLAEETQERYAHFALSSAENWMTWIQILSKIIKACGKPMIVFIDEIDELGLNRNVNRTHVYELLRLLDGVEDNKNVKFIATTNRPEDLDEALLRVGRLGPIMYIDVPDSLLKRRILEYFLAKYDLSNIDLDEIVTMTNGDITGADIRAAVEDCIIDDVEPTEKQIRDNLQRIKLAREKVNALREERRPKYPWEQR